MKFRKSMKKGFAFLAVMTLLLANVMNVHAEETAAKIVANAKLVVIFGNVHAEEIDTTVVKAEGIVGDTHRFSIGEEVQLPEGYQLAKGVPQPTTFTVYYGTESVRIVIVEPIPVDPEEPEVPVDPENPDPGTDPEEPEVPVDPENPDPEEPEVPVDPEKPVDPENPSTSEDANESAVPKTGDNAGTAGLAIALGASVIAILTVVGKKRM